MRNRDHNGLGTAMGGLVLAAAMYSPVSLVWAGEREAIADGIWKERTQVVTEPASQLMERRNVRVWTSKDLADADFIWDAELPPGLSQTGEASGFGKIQWREAGTSVFDHTSVLGSYKGEVSGGRFSGLGNFQDHTGRSYEGTWSDGQMSGMGILRTPDGVTFAGEFRRGAKNGKGREARPDGTVISGIWRDGRLAEVPLPTSPMQLAQASIGPVTVTAYVDRRRNASERKTAGGADAILLYEQDDSPDRLSIRPDNETILGLWKGNTSLGRYGKPEIGYGPAYVLLDIKNAGPSPVQVVDGYLQVSNSATDMQPYLDLTSAFDPACASAGQKLDPQIALNNTGWGPVKDAKLTFGFTSSNGHLEDAGQTFTAVVGSFMDRKETTVLPALRELGVNIARIQQGNLACPSKSAVPQCLRQLIDSGAFGSMSASSLRRASNKTEESASAIVVTTITGRIDYTWTNSEGQVNQRRSPFSIEIPLTSFKVGAMAECGAGGPEDIHPQIMLKTDGTNYRLPLQYRASLAPGQNTRLSLSLGAEKASKHNFQVVLRLSDGSMARSGPIDLLYFKDRRPN